MRDAIASLKSEAQPKQWSATFIVDRGGNLAALALGPRTWDNDAAHSLVEGLTR